MSDFKLPDVPGMQSPPIPEYASAKRALAMDASVHTNGRWTLKLFDFDEDRKQANFTLLPAALPPTVERVPDPRRSKYSADEIYVDTRLGHVETDDDEFQRMRPKLNPNTGYADQLPDEKDPRLMYRGVSAEEMAFIRRTGVIQSTGTYNIGPDQVGKTSYGANINTADAYANSFAPVFAKPTFDAPSYILAVRRPEHAVPIDGGHEIEVAGPLSVEHIERVIELRPYGIRNGYVDMRQEWFGDIHRGSANHPSVYTGYRTLPPNEMQAMLASERVFLTKDDIEERKGGWGGDPNYYTLKSEPGSIIRGTMVTPSQLPPTLFHVTTNVPAVLDSGYLRASNDMAQGGLGGGRSTGNAVSFTTSPHDALNIKTSLLRAGMLARGEVGIEAIHQWAAEDERRAGLPAGALHASAAIAEDNYNVNIQVLRENNWPHNPANSLLDAYKMYLTSRSFVPGAPDNPVVMGSADSFAQIDPTKVGIVAVPATSIPTGPLIRQNPDNSRSDFLHEVQVHGNVPLTNAKVLSAHGVQHPHAEPLPSAYASPDVVRVKAYTRPDGVHVASHNRRLR